MSDRPIIFMDEKGNVTTTDGQAVKAMFDAIPEARVGRKLMPLVPADTLASKDAALAEIRAENERLRAALALSDQPCAYCSLPADEWNRCQHGFPGCDRSDDAMGCRELGASLRLAAAESELALVKKALVIANAQLADMEFLSVEGFMGWKQDRASRATSTHEGDTK